MDFFKKCRKWLCQGALMLGLLLYALTGKEAAAMDDKAKTILFATDIHYLSPSLTDYGPIFQTLMEKGDGKLTEYSAEIMEGLLEAARENGCDTVVLAGDLTFNGEHQSLVDLREMFERAQQQGLRVLVIPGNHDIAYPYACEYRGDKAKRVPAISQKDFREMMEDFGYGEASLKDGSSFSYVYPLTEKDWLLFLDANTEKAPGKIGDATLYWLRETLEEAKAKEKRVTIICHQNLLPHSSFMSGGFVLGNGVQVVDLVRSFGVSLALTGHSHLQDTVERDGLTDICTESASVAPLRYALVSFPEEGEVGYEKRDLSLRQREAKERFFQVVGNQVRKSLVKKNLTETEMSALVSFAQDVNLAYFSGYLDDRSIHTLKEGARWKLWGQKAKDTFWYIYMASYLVEESAPKKE